MPHDYSLRKSATGAVPDGRRKPNPQQAKRMKAKWKELNPKLAEYKSKTGAHSNAQWYLEGRHKEAVLRKHQRVQMYRTLIDEWERHPNADHDYINSLKRRLRSAETQLKAMRP